MARGAPRLVGPRCRRALSLSLSLAVRYRPCVTVSARANSALRIRILVADSCFAARIAPDGERRSRGSGQAVSPSARQRVSRSEQRREITTPPPSRQRQIPPGATATSRNVTTTWSRRTARKVGVRVAPVLPPRGLFYRLITFDTADPLLKELKHLFLVIMQFHGHKANTNL